jgi:hypothetical protein
MKPFVGGGDESKDSNATPKTTTAGPRGRQFRVDLDVDGARQGAEISEHEDRFSDLRSSGAVRWRL